jgi:hypothetical protein
MCAYLYRRCPHCTYHPFVFAPTIPFTHPSTPAGKTFNERLPLMREAAQQLQISARTALDASNGFRTAPTLQLDPEAEKYLTKVYTHFFVLSLVRRAPHLRASGFQSAIF